MNHSPPKSLAGIGLKSCHYGEILERLPPLGFFEIHAENYMGAGGPPHRWLNAIRENYELSIHGVGLSLGSAGPLDPDHLTALAHLVDRYQPQWVSEHLAWCGIDGVFLNDLLPIPYTEASLTLFADHVDQTQERLGRRILIENPSASFAYANVEMTEPEFLSEVVRRTGCGLLLDVNNLFVSARNLGLDEYAYLEALPQAAIGEYHLAGHATRRIAPDATLRIDDHGSQVCADVWALYRHTIRLLGPHPTLIEWDNDIPSLDVLLREADRADQAALGKGGIHAVAE